MRDEKDAALSDLSRTKQSKFERENEVSDECNVKVAHLENLLLESRERSRF